MFVMIVHESLAGLEQLKTVLHKYPPAPAHYAAYLNSFGSDSFTQRALSVHLESGV